MHIALFFWDRLPVPEYGGTQRMVVALARGLAAAGHRVTLVAGHGSQVPEATLVPVALDAARRPDFDIRPLLPRTFSTLSQAEEENGQSRVYLGIHWSFDKTAGIAQGRAIADEIFSKAAQRRRR